MTLFGVNPLVKSLVRSYAEGNMTSQVQVLRGTLGDLDPATGLVGGLTGSTVIYSGPARIHPVNGGGVNSIGGGEIDTRSAVISIPIDTQRLPHRDDLVSILSDDDTTLDTRIFRVLDVDGGGFFSDARRMTCMGWYESRYWGTQ